MLHGTADARIPAAEMEPGKKLLEAWGAKVETKLYPGLGHSIDNRELQDAAAFLKTVLPTP